ncbi:Fc.00g093330.m01.CDS01 [Cosmosporella sp. VM-42]
MIPEELSINIEAGFAHSVTKDDVYEGYHTPKGAFIIPNQWAILRDEEQYLEPEAFKPERWLKPDYPTYREPLTQHPSLKKFVGLVMDDGSVPV